MEGILVVERKEGVFPPHPNHTTTKNTFQNDKGPLGNPDTWIRAFPVMGESRCLHQCFHLVRSLGLHITATLSQECGRGIVCVHRGAALQPSVWERLESSCVSMWLH